MTGEKSILINDATKLKNTKLKVEMTTTFCGGWIGKIVADVATPASNH